MRNITWYGDRWKAGMEREARNRISACAIAVHNRAKLLVSVEGAGSTVRTKKGQGHILYDKRGRYLGGSSSTEVVQHRGRRKQIGDLIYNAFPSAPGEPPHKQTGRLLGSVAWEIISNLVARVGTNINNPPYPRYLEFGTRKMAARPWLRRSLNEMVPFIRAVWRRPWRMSL